VLATPTIAATENIRRARRDGIGFIIGNWAARCINEPGGSVIPNSRELLLRAELPPKISFDYKDVPDYKGPSSL
jgi:hypothetical protein